LHLLFSALQELLMAMEGVGEEHLWLLHSILLAIEAIGARIASDAAGLIQAVMRLLERDQTDEGDALGFLPASFEATKKGAAETVDSAAAALAQTIGRIINSIAASLGPFLQLLPLGLTLKQGQKSC